MGSHSMPSWEKSKATWTTSSSPVRSMTLTIVTSSCIFTTPSRVVERYSEFEGLVKKGLGGRSGASPETKASGGDATLRPVETRSSTRMRQLDFVPILNHPSKTCTHPFCQIYYMVFGPSGLPPRIGG